MNRKLYTVRDGYNIMEKVVIIINGTGGVGKDTLCNLMTKYFKVQIISSITPIKEAAEKYFGWKGQKDSKSRKLLADLKKLSVEYNDTPFRYLCEQYNRFLKSRAQILFVHIREGEEIDKFKKHVQGACYTLLVTRKLNETIRWGNVSDDSVAKYVYDLTYENSKPLKDVGQDFYNFLVNNTEGKLYKESIFSNMKRQGKNLGQNLRVVKKLSAYSQKYIKISQ